MQYVITVPEDIRFINVSVVEGKRVEKVSEQDPPFLFSTYICEMVTNDVYFSKTPVLWEAAVDLVKKFKNVKAGDIVFLADSEYRHLKAATESPAAPYGNMHMMKQLVPFSRAILHAEKEEEYEKRIAKDSSGKEKPTETQAS